MATNDNEKFGFFASGLLLGGTIGAILGILYAPDSGKRTRKKINRKTDEIMDDVVTYAKQSRDKAEDILEDGRKRVDELVGEAKKILEKK